MSKNQYVARYWKNDGDWHEGFDYNPTLAFYAEDDQQAQQLAFDYIRLNNHGNCYDFDLSRLVRISVETREVPFQKTEKRLTRVEGKDAREKLERRLKRAHFVALKDAIVPPKK